MKLPNNNITTTLISNTIGTVSNNIGVLCTSNKINKWSKYKPISYSSINNIYTDDSIIQSINYGLSISASTNYKALSYWIYIKPTGGSTSPYRLGDFRNYNHAATPPITVKGYNKNINVFYKTNDYVTAFINSDESDAITINNLPLIKDYYFGVVFEDSNGNKYPITSTDTFMNGGSSIYLNFNTAPFNTMTNTQLTGYTACFKYSRVQNSAVGTNEYIALPSNNSNLIYLNIIKTLGLNTYSNHITSQSTPNFSFFSITDYTFATTGGDDLYFTSSGSVFFKLKLTNTTSDIIPFNLNALSLRFDKTLNRDTQLTVTPNVYINNILKTGIINIPVGGFIEIVIGHTQVLGYNSVGTYIQPLASTKKTITPTVYYNSTLVHSFGAIRMSGNA